MSPEERTANENEPQGEQVLERKVQMAKSRVLTAAVASLDSRVAGP